MVKLPLGDTQPIAAAANDLQAQRRLLQLTSAFVRADRRPYTQTTGSMVTPLGEHGDILIHFWADSRTDVATKIAEIFQNAGLETNVYKLPRENDDEAQRAIQTMVLIGIAARPAANCQDEFLRNRS
jgi:hypothetical protein